jgi:hypothetical protein
MKRMWEAKIGVHFEDFICLEDAVKGIRGCAIDVHNCRDCAVETVG